MGKNKNYNKNQFKKSKTNNDTTVAQQQQTIEEKPDFKIDGSILEGGGQILRNSVALASLFNKAISIEKIRYNRDQPGLKNQHKAGIDLMSRLFKAHLTGCSVGSCKLYYQPTQKTIQDDGVIEADTKTAGSICLMIQVSLPCLIFAPHSTKMVLGGGTNCDFAPAADYIQNVFLPIATTMGFKCEMSIDKRGFYPKGGGAVTLTTQPLTQPLSPITIVNKGEVNRIVIKSYFTSPRISPLVAERMNNTAKKLIKKDFKKVDVETELIDVSKFSFGDGTFIEIRAYTDQGCIFGATGNGAIGVPAEKVAEDAANSLLKDLQDGGCMDEYLQDQLIIFMALAKGKSQIKTGPISLHTQTSIHITSLMTGAIFTITPLTNNTQSGEETNLITCEGISYFPSDLNNNNNNSNSNTTTTTTTTTISTTTIDNQNSEEK
ncbi:RNA 3'-terminal phosphate cyclase [Dictyostelium discoideum AX4]|uniref:Probable RNA 3'-terminal phosphate cyclase n=1 Tax=Dictyostelium discoideum TaxID=44689 RepID=RTCA_DICDI|nr:RNA 3'-terminal phosphate cyclase [Dictyostelium discoideum AX4]O15746.1 RecName: Full=Probable RNA 3'-terminal phosphate cyclase; Short=RNA cyclase; Short=RNA-3'-phosphate cyclase [Dictyostelium discoideum]AAB70847.1 similar to H. sapiens phosphate cyclase encoded by GenBank Accession Number Y11651 [Dictyostelium discoideum]EAL69379.1 RNA 3'-terminal phosphate cyclase [Dictyostelium discoideum AX4]|eukprot:XP_643263.1 RNA 3'-terminal phosphate cyclase [Dictyostelium discoideum AX4]